MTQFILKNKKKWGVLACILTFCIMVCSAPTQVQASSDLKQQKRIKKAQTQLYNLIDDEGADQTANIMKYGVYAADKYGVATAKKKMIAKYGSETAKQAFPLLSFFQWGPIAYKIIKYITSNGGLPSSLSSFLNNGFLGEIFKLITGGKNLSLPSTTPTPPTTR